MNEYELTVIIQPSADEAAQTAIKDRISQYVTASGGEVLSSRDWGSRALAYPVRKQSAGVYVVTRFRVAPGAIAELQRILRYTEDVLRFVAVRAEGVPQRA
jgi:small subunit ribosomal protein S6